MGRRAEDVRREPWPPRGFSEVVNEREATERAASFLGRGALVFAGLEPAVAPESDTAERCCAAIQQGHAAEHWWASHPWHPLRPIFLVAAGRR